MTLRGKPWSKLARAMQEAGQENPDYAAWMVWIKGKCPKVYACLDGAANASDVATETYDGCKELYDAFCGNQA